MILLWLLLTLAGLLILVVLLRAVNFKPLKKKFMTFDHINLNETKIINNFIKLLQFKTISSYNKEEVDTKEFDGFRNVLDQLYPNVSTTCPKKFIGETGILYHWKGKHKGSVTVLMSHYDVVPADEKYWSVPPFAGLIKNGYIWGRGTLDTKCTLLSILEGAELLIEEGYQPEHDIYFSFSGEEEISGESALDIVNYFEGEGIYPELVLDEGGVVVDRMFPGVNQKIALIGTSEKGYMDIAITGTSEGGHASAPPAKTLSQAMANVMLKIEKNNLKGEFTLPVKELFNRAGRYSNFGNKLIFSNMWLFEPLLKAMFKKKGGQLNALIRTTMAVTKIKGSDAYNVLPTEGSIGVNVRLLNTMPSEKLLQYLQEIIGEYGFKYEVIGHREASPITPTDTEQFGLMEEVIKGIWPEAIVSPYLMIAGTDSRHFNKICKNVMRFSPMDISKEELNLIHSNDERIKIDSVMKSVHFYIELMKKI